ncbi:hypothetical protein RJ639_012679 [Escallonia herrerae]|uniref:Uncharacterized protein n=1 Tax=Escallonia herrerae TaxID=1293975 RepID=A0AA88VSW4_9ASTE|nr:hypothetical protein RJ639_012679 [Escallonia herrerae]
MTWSRFWLEVKLMARRAAVASVASWYEVWLKAIIPMLFWEAGWLPHTTPQMWRPFSLCNFGCNKFLDLGIGIYFSVVYLRNRLIVKKKMHGNMNQSSDVKGLLHNYEDIAISNNMGGFAYLSPRNSKLSQVRLFQSFECTVYEWMSLSKGWYQGCKRLMHGMKEKGSKCEYSNIKCARDSNTYSSSLKQARGFSGALDSDAYKAAVNDKVKRAEDSLRIVMYLSCWGPN